MSDTKKLSIAEIVAAATQMKKKSEDNRGSRPQATFLPAGESTIRIFADPTGAISRNITTHGYFGSGIQTPADCAEIPENFNYAKLDDMLEELNAYNHWKYGAKKNFLFYAQVIDTKVGSDNWEAGKFYVVVGNWRVEEAFTNMFTSIAQSSPEVLEAMLDPAKEAPGIAVNLTMGTQGSCTFSTLYTKTAPVPLDDTYQGLDKAYVADGFNQERYNKLITRIAGELDEIRNVRKAKGQPLYGTAEWAAAEAAEAAKDEDEKAPEQTPSTPATPADGAADVPADKPADVPADTPAAEAESTTTEPSKVANRFDKYKAQADK